MKIDHAINTVTEAEQDLADQLERVAGRHGAEHDVYHLGHKQAVKAAARARSLTDFAQKYGADAPRQSDPDPGVMDTLRRQTSELLGRAQAPGLILLRDLQETYLQAQRAEIAWVVLQQGAKACRDLELVEAVTSAHEECETTAKWLRTRLKVAAPQVLAVG
ncbi:hypothetical protein [Pedococcus sp. 5OH_020]|uniref:hypothetical protein n=1 Tax=Pedococcus sp. 5OH_020 TaxID=2989814 RepID=UPI0022E9F998|nr:hypothetical protein [Pedococcus sp. 5OH_020]